MIGYVRGSVLQKFKSGKNTASLVLWTGEKDSFGVGYTVLVSDHFVGTLEPDQTVILWTYSVHTENDSYLIGFDSSEKMRMFLELLDVSGVGPRTAMTIVDTVGVENIIQAIATSDVKTFSSVPGIGQKTAAKIMVELSGKDLDITTVLIPQQIDVSAHGDVLATLQKLGYSVANAKEAVAKATAELAMQPQLSTAEKVKLVLSK